MCANHLREWLQEHWAQEVSVEAEDGGLMLELGRIGRGTEDRIAVIIYYAYKISYLFQVIRWIHISYGFYFSIYGFGDIICYP